MACQSRFSKVINIKQGSGRNPTSLLERMKKIVFIMALMASSMCYGQDTIPRELVPETFLKEGVIIRRGGTTYTSKTYTEIYEVITDSIVHRFGLEFRNDSTFVRRVPMEGTNRKLYDRMQSDIQDMKAHQEQARKETIEFLNGYRASYPVWLYFKFLGIFGK